MKKICICGGGNLGLVCACVLSSRGYEVNIFTGHPDNWSSELKVIDPDGNEFIGSPALITSNASQAINGVDIVLLCLPGYVIEKTLLQINPLLSPECLVGSVVSSTGFFFFAHDIMPKQPLFGFQRVPYICRTEKYGHIGRLLGYKKSLNVVAENISDIDEFLGTITDMFQTPVALLESFYEAALTNSNPILHTSRLYTMWSGEVKPLPQKSFFYREWTDEASSLMIEMDSEFQTLLRALNIREGAVPPLLDYYESTDAESLTRKLRSIEAFQKIETPMVETPEGWLPDFKCRYITEDFPFGLRFIKELSDKNGVHVPRITQVLNWGLSVSSPKNKK